MEKKRNSGGLEGPRKRKDEVTAFRKCEPGEHHTSQSERKRVKVSNCRPKTNTSESKKNRRPLQEGRLLGTSAPKKKKKRSRENREMSQERRSIRREKKEEFAGNLGGRSSGRAFPGFGYRGGLKWRRARLR